MEFGGTGLDTRYILGKRERNASVNAGGARSIEDVMIGEVASVGGQ